MSIEEASSSTSYEEKSLSHRAAVVQYFDINVVFLDLLLVHQRVILTHLSDSLNSLHKEQTAPGMIVVKLYSDRQSDI
jgi:hypothetical protein